MTSRLYWIGLYEESKKWKAFFQVDYAPAISYFAKCVFGTGTHMSFAGRVVLVLTGTNYAVLLSLSFGEMIVFFWLFYMLSSLFIYLHISLFHASPIGITLGVFFGIALGVELLCFRIGLFVCAITSNLDVT